MLKLSSSLLNRSRRSVILRNTVRPYFRIMMNPPNNNNKCIIIPSTDEGIQEAAKMLQGGQCVAFPTGKLRTRIPLIPIVQ